MKNRYTDSVCKFDLIKREVCQIKKIALKNSFFGMLYFLKIKFHLFSTLLEGKSMGMFINKEITTINTAARTSLTYTIYIIFI